MGVGYKSLRFDRQTVKVKRELFCSVRYTQFDKHNYLYAETNNKAYKVSGFLQATFIFFKQTYRFTKTFV